MTKYKLHKSPYEKRGNKGYWNNKVKRLVNIKKHKKK